MKHYGIASFFAGVAIIVFGCSSSVSPGDSETHWVACKTTADCHGGRTCERERCVDPASVDGGTPGTVDGGTPGTGAGGMPGAGGSGAGGAGGATGDVPDGRARITNPTGTCVAPDSGARRGYHYPDRGDVWLPDCKNPLKREYFRVFAQSETSAYVMPRPDGAHQVVGACNSATHPMRALVEKYSLCEVASDQATVERINHMTPADALALTHFMHGLLFFEAQEGVPDANLRPFGIPSDAVDACALHPSELSTELAADCAAQRRAIDSGLESPSFYSTASQLAPLLNELYGVAGCVRPDHAGPQCTQCGPVGCSKLEIVCVRRCTTSTDCIGSTAGSDCVASFCRAPDSFCPF